MYFLLPFLLNDLMFTSVLALLGHLLPACVKRLEGSGKVPDPEAPINLFNFDGINIYLLDFNDKISYQIYFVKSITCLYPSLICRNHNLLLIKFIQCCVSHSVISSHNIKKLWYEQCIV